MYPFSVTLGEGDLVFSPANVIFAGIGILLSGDKDARASQDPLIDIFERIEMFLRRLEMYTEVPPTAVMMHTTIQIMVEVISVLGIATMKIKEGRMKKYTKKLIGRTDMEDVLMRLDKLTQEEARMATAQILEAAPTVDESGRGAAESVYDLNSPRGFPRNSPESSMAIRARRDSTISEEIWVDDVDSTGSTPFNLQVVSEKRREKILKWLSPPDPSTNHNIACSTHHKKTATWFFQGSIFQEWKSTGSLLWIHGKPGSGKSVICSSVIQDIEARRGSGNVSMAYFYFDFRDTNKQSLRDLVSSFLAQLSALSVARHEILSDLYLASDQGNNQPSDSTLVECLKRMLTFSDHRPIYLIMDALDESPNTSGIPSPRERVLHLLKELVDLRLSSVHIFVTSRFEIDIQDVIAPLTSLRVSLHDQSGQKQDIVDYIKSVVYSNSEPIMRRWRTEDKELAIEVLTERADGMFRWVFCQLEELRHWLPPSIRRVLEELPLPDSLDETYERVLREIKKQNRYHAQLILQCLTVALRPLRVEEFAEIFAIDFDDAERIPKLRRSLRWEDPEQTLLNSCSSLITIVDTGDSRVVQLSHFSAREFLTSARLATSSQDVSRYHIALEPAHTVLAQACVSALLQSVDYDKQDDVRTNSPLVRYAAEHWVHHAQFENVASRIKGMEYLFDLDKPYFVAWRQFHDIDTSPPDPSVFFQFTPISKSDANTPLYYAALCGLPNLVEQLTIKHPQHVDAPGGYYMTPAVAALAGGHFQLARLLHRSGSPVDTRGHFNRTPLHSAAYYGDLEMVQILFDYGVDVNAQDDFGSTPLDFASWGHFNNPRVVQLLLDHGADPNVEAQHGLTPLYLASHYGRVEIVHLLIEHGASVEVEDEQGRTPLDVASGEQRDEIIALLSTGATILGSKGHNISEEKEVAVGVDEGDSSIGRDSNLRHSTTTTGAQLSHATSLSMGSKVAGRYFSSLARNASTRMDVSKPALPPRSSKRSLTAPNPRPVQIISAPSVPGGPRAPPGRVQRSQTLMLSSSPVSSGNASTSMPMRRWSNTLKRPSFFGRSTPGPSPELDVPASTEFTRQVERLADLLPHADKDVLAGYLSRAGQDILAIGQYLEDEKNGTVRRQ